LLLSYISKIRVVEREMQEYHENENAKEAQQNLGVDEETLMAPLSSKADLPAAAAVAST